jgi:Na+-translocating ferredoxin:NAD+ oxidoreductase RnfD subunit
MLIAVLLLLILVAIAGTGHAFAAFRLVRGSVAGAALFAMAIDAAVLRYQKHRWVFPDGALLSGLIVAMIVSPHEPPLVAVATAVVAVLSKYLVRIRTANVFNPAALALVATFYLFHTGQSWWGALPEISAMAVVLLIVSGAIIAQRVNRVPAALAFLGAYFALATAAAFASDPRHVTALYRAPDLHAALFFAFFMVTDPPTSPPGDRDQLLFGVLTGVASFVVFETIGAAYFLLAGLLVANVWEARRRVRVHAARLALSHPIGD